MNTQTFIIDCPWCKAKVAAERSRLAEDCGFDDEAGEPYGNRLYVGKCPSCETLLAGESHQVDFAGHNAHEDQWSDIVRIHPKPSRTFSSWRIPRVVTDSLLEADKSLQAGASTASCVMLGRALEAVCRDVLIPGSFAPQPTGPGRGPAGAGDGRDAQRGRGDYSHRAQHLRRREAGSQIVFHYPANSASAN